MDYFKSIKLPSHLHQEHIIPAFGISAALLYTFYRLLRQDKPSGFKEIPVPGSSYPYVGHFLSLGELPGKQVAKWISELGPIIKLKMGKQTWIAVGDPLLAHKILTINGAHTSNRPYSTFGSDYYSKGHKGLVFAQPGPEHSRNRAIASSVLSPKRLDTLIDSINRESANLVKCLLNTTEKEGSVNPIEMLELNSMNVAFNALFGRRLESVEDPEFIKISSLMIASIKYAGLEEDLPNFLPITSIFSFMSSKKKKWADFVDNQLHPTFENLIREALASDTPCVVKSLEERGLSMLEKIIFASDFISAGTDTVFTTLSWIILVLCCYPSAQKLAADEIDTFIKTHGRKPSFSDRLEVPLCISIIKECMRFRTTSSFGLPHSATKDIVVDGYLIPKNVTIITSMESMHFNPKYVDNPEVFDPKRFLDNTRTMHSAANGRPEERDHYIFGWGRRVCPGTYMAEAELFSAFVELLSKATIEPNDEGLPEIDGAVNAGLTLLPRPYKYRFVRRSDALVA